MPMFFGLEQGVHSENVDNVADRRLRSGRRRRGDRQQLTHRTTARPAAGAYLPAPRQVRPGGSSAHAAAHRHAPPRTPRPASAHDGDPRDRRTPSRRTEEGHGPLRRAPPAADDPRADRRVVPDLRDGLRPARRPDPRPRPATGRSRRRSQAQLRDGLQPRTTRCSSSTASTSATWCRATSAPTSAAAPVIDTIAAAAAGHGQADAGRHALRERSSASSPACSPASGATASSTTSCWCRPR